MGPSAGHLDLTRCKSQASLSASYVSDISDYTDSDEESPRLLDVSIPITTISEPRPILRQATPNKPSGTPRKRSRVEREPAWRAVALDNDETLGSWGQASLMYVLWRKVLGQQPRVKDFVDHYLALGGARPGTMKLLGELNRMKKAGKIDEVVMYTGASNHDGWVSFVKECLEEYAGTPGLFGRVISREVSSPAAQDGRMWKDLSIVSPHPEQVFLVDDKPEYCLNGQVIGVPEYRKVVSMTKLTEILQGHVEHPSLKHEIAQLIEKDAREWKTHVPDLLSDNAWVIYEVLPRLTEAFANSLDDSFKLNLDLGQRDKPHKTAKLQ